MRIENKPSTLGATVKGHNVKPLIGQGDKDGDGGSPVPARDYRHKKTLLTKKQLEFLVGKGAYESFFNTGKKPAEPGFKTFSKLKLDSEYKDCDLEIVFGVSNKTITIDEGVRISNIVIRFEDTGFATMDCTTTAIYPHDIKTLELENFLGKLVHCSFGFGKLDEGEENKQQKLGLEDAGTNAAEGDDDEEDDE